MHALSYQVEVSCDIHMEIVGTYEVDLGDRIDTHYCPDDGTADPIDYCHLCAKEQDEAVT